MDEALKATMISLAKAAAGDERFVVGMAPLGYEITTDVNGNIEVGGVKGKTIATVLLFFAALGVWKAGEIVAGKK